MALTILAIFVAVVFLVLWTRATNIRTIDIMFEHFEKNPDIRDDVVEIFRQWDHDQGICSCVDEEDDDDDFIFEDEDETFEEAAQYARDAVFLDRLGNLEDAVSKLENKNAKKGN